jgi:hypothetical protein
LEEIKRTIIAISIQDNSSSQEDHLCNMKNKDDEILDGETISILNQRYFNKINDMRMKQSKELNPLQMLSLMQSIGLAIQ